MLGPPNGGRWLVARSLHVPGGGVASVVRSDDGLTEGLLWQGHLPDRVTDRSLPSVHLGDKAGQPATLELLVPGLLLDELDLATDHPGWAEILSTVGVALAVLHAGGKSHGAVAPDRIWVAVDGSVLLVGAGLQAGTAQADGEALRSLVSSAPASPSAGARMQLARRVLERRTDDGLHSLDERTDARGGLADERTHAGDGRVLGLLDEVSEILGSDGGRGLLDTNSEATGWTDRTLPGEPTGVVTAAGRDAHLRLSALARLTDMESPRLSDRKLAALAGAPLPGLAALLARERTSLPPLPDAGPPPNLPWRLNLDPDAQPTSIRANLAPVIPPVVALSEPTAPISALRVSPEREPEHSALRGAVIFAAGVLLTLAVGLVLLLTLQIV